ncbi:hypothetical protein Scep_022820 [Stephania cephalantha]|uniref:Berberine/berberine-like domain-containing protein n=1 Tax=Stephania cephalantha TaxID=152367 RepID=A0AAP0I2G0_9MAGN
MESSHHTILSLFTFLVLTTQWKASSASSDDFLQCLATNSNESKPQVYIPNNPSYLTILQSSINNLRFAMPETPKPQFIITPDHDSQVQAVVVCSKKYGLNIKVRSGGHDFEGLSYTSNVPFVLIDLINLLAKTLEQGATDVVHKWQSVASYGVPKEIFIGLHVGVVNKNSNATNGGVGRTVQATFQVLFLGPTENLVYVMDKSFPELGMERKDCTKMSWVESTVRFAGFPSGTPVDILLNRSALPKTTFKAKSDFVTEPIPKSGLEGIWKRFLKEERPEMVIGVWGGKVNEIADDKIAFPHRAGNMYLIDHVTNWDGKEGPEASKKHIAWIRELHEYMTPYVSKSPRTAFLNYKDLDLGRIGASTYSDPKIWGEMYFKSNFKRLVKVKSMVDPDNFFSGEQNIPPTITY